ncbi:MAG: class II aldolase/adducin family protein [Candidatus Thermoplasmatota archaeon]|nr:class II aldolase/adducin family protein [Candidatus Thermoplasmatota archaeon]
MAKKKTSAEVAREQSEIAKVEGMLGDAFGSLGDLEQNSQEDATDIETKVVEEKVNDEPAEEVEESVTNDTSVENKITESEDGQEIASETISEDTTAKPSQTPTSSQPAKSRKGPPKNKPPNDNEPKIPTVSTGPQPKKPSGAKSKPPKGPPKSLLSSDDEVKSPATPPPVPPPSKPSGPPPSKPSGPPPKLPNKPPSESTEIPTEEVENVTEIGGPGDISTIEDTQVVADKENEIEVEKTTEDTDEMPEVVETTENLDNEKADDTKEEEVEQVSQQEIIPPEEKTADQEEDISAKEAEIARLSAEVERLRSSMSGAADIIEEMENPPMPPVVHEDLVIGAHIVADMARMARQLDRDALVRASMGTIAMLHPDRLDVLISTKNKSLLPRMNEQDLCAGKLNADPPRGAPADWRVLEVLLASTSIVTGGPAAVIHCHGAYSTAVSCEKDLVLMQPIDEIGKNSIGKVIIVDPDDENPREYLRQVAEALNQGGMRCVVIRGNGAYAVGADLDQAWANAAMLEHSMKIVMLARQANLKI